MLDETLQMKVGYWTAWANAFAEPIVYFFLTAIVLTGMACAKKPDRTIKVPILEGSNALQRIELRQDEIIHLANQIPD